MRVSEYSHRPLPGFWAFCTLLALLVATCMWIASGPFQMPLPLRIAIAVSIAIAGLALGTVAIRSSRRALHQLGSTLRDLAGNRPEARAPLDLGGICGDLARDLNRLAERLGQLRDNFDERVGEQTQRLRRERDQLAAQNQTLRGAAAREQDEARAQSERLSSMSHELRTPLTGILGYADLLRRTRLDSEQMQQLDTIDKSARALLTMINDLLDWSRIEAGRLKLDEIRFELYDTVESTIALLAPLAYEKDLELVRIIYHDVPHELRGDAQRLRQILTNLLSNAIKFTARGEVVLRVMGEREESGRTWLRFAVSDTGIGIALEQQERLFQPFRQVGRSQQGSSGLGLSISRKLAELMGGEISLESSPGHGSTFSVLLPFKLIAAAESTPHENQPLGDHRVWLYEPHPAARLAWLHWLEFWGLSVQNFASADALAEALFNTGSGRRPALIVLGLNAQTLGQTSLTRVLEQAAAEPEAEPVPVIALVNSVTPSLLEHLRGAGASIVHPKSVPRQRLYLDLRRLLSEGPQTGLPLAGRRALVADNNLVNRRYLSMICSHLGLQALEAADGREAFEIWRRERPEIVLLDAHMPVLDGLGCARSIRAQESGTPACRIIAVSAYLEPDERRAFLDAGADAVLIKPFDESQLLAILDPEARKQQHSAAKLAQDPELLALLQEELPEQYQALERAVNAESLDEAREAAHTLRGTAAFYHLAQLRQTTAAVEEWLRSADSLASGPVARRRLDNVRSAVSETLAAMDRA